VQSTQEQKVAMERQQADRADDERKRIMAARAVRDERERKLREEEERLWKAETSKLSYIGALREGRANPLLSPEDLTLEQVALLEAKFQEDEAHMAPRDKRGSKIWVLSHFLYSYLLSFIVVCLPIYLPIESTIINGCESIREKRTRFIYVA
jgi:hypothetical protein